MRSFNTQFIVFSGVFTALTILFTHVFSIETVFVRISFGFLPIAVFAAIFGPLRGGIMAGVADLIGCLLFTPGLFFPGFTVSAFCSGVIYGYFFHTKKISMMRIASAIFLIIFIIDLGLNTLWLTLLYHKAASVFLASRILKCIVLFPVQVMLFYSVYKALCHYPHFYRSVSKL